MNIRLNLDLFVITHAYLNPPVLIISTTVREQYVEPGMEWTGTKLKESTGPTNVKVVPYTFVRRGVPVKEDTYPEPSACDVGWPVPFLAAFISPVLPPGTHLRLGEQ